MRTPSRPSPPQAAGNMHGGGIMAVLLILVLFFLWLWAAYQPDQGTTPESDSIITSQSGKPIAPPPPGADNTRPGQQRWLQARLAIPSLDQISAGGGGFHAYLGLGGWDEEEWQRFWTEQPGEEEHGLSPEESAQRLLDLAQIHHWQPLEAADLSQVEGQLQIKRQVASAAVYELLVLQRDPAASKPHDGWLWRQRLSAPRDPDQDLVFQAIQRQALAYIQPQADELSEARLMLRLQVDAGDASWQWLRQRLADEAGLLIPSQSEPLLEPWWQAYPISQLDGHLFGPVAAGQTLRWSLSASGISDGELVDWQARQVTSDNADFSGNGVQLAGELSLQQGENVLPLQLQPWQRFFASRVDLQVQLRDGETRQGVAGFGIYRAADHFTLCLASDDNGQCQLSSIASDQPSEFLIEAPTEAQEWQPGQDLPRYPTRFSQHFDPLDHAEALAAGAQSLALSWDLPVFQWLHVAPAALAELSADAPVAGEGFPIFFLQQQQHDASQADTPPWQMVNAEHFIQRDDGLWISIPAPGRYRVVAALDTLDFARSEAVQVSETSTPQALNFPAHRQARFQLVSALEQLPGSASQQSYAVYCADFPLAPRLISRSELLQQGLEVSGCARVVWEWETPSGESDTLWMDLAAD